MAVTEGNLPIGGTTKELATTVVKQADGSFVHREEVVVADPETAAARAAVQTSADVRDYGLLMRGADDYQITDLLALLISEMRIMNQHMELITGASLQASDVNDDLN